MNIAAIDVMQVSLPFRFSFKHSLADRSLSNNLVVRVRLADGTVGYGESIPREYVTGESIESALNEVSRNFAPSLIGRDFGDFIQCLDLLKQTFKDLQLTRKRSGAAWCALELAVLDAVAKWRQANLTDLLGSDAAEQVRYGAVVPFGGKKALLGILLFYKLYGFKTVKLKVGTNIDEDVDRLRTVRRIMGSDAIIRVDANCAWTPDLAQRAVERFRPLGVLSYEQPFPAEQFDQLSKLTASIPEEVLADESLCTLEDASVLAKDRVVSAFNIRISKVGGLIPALRMAEIARAHNLSIHMGAQVGESGILSAAGRVFACLQSHCKNYEGSDNTFLLKHDLTREDLTVKPGGFGKRTMGSGLGVNVIDSRLGSATSCSSGIGRLAAVGAENEVDCD
jgi:L-Ala-D/L-Glu epimerase